MYMTMVLSEFEGEVSPEIVTERSFSVKLELSRERLADIVEGFKGVSKLDETCSGDDSATTLRGMMLGLAEAKRSGLSPTFHSPREVASAIQ